MKFAWTVQGDDPDFAQGDKHGIDGYFYPMFDSLTTPDTVKAAGAWGGGRAIGIYLGHHWPQIQGKTAEQVAILVNDEWKRVTKNNATNKALRIMINNEDHDPFFIADTLEAIRKLRPVTGLSFSPEGMQGGWMGPVLSPGQAPAADGFVARVLRARVRIVPQTFWGANGTIAGNYAFDAVLRDLLKRGFPESSVSMFLDGQTLDSFRNADGYVFTMGRLPWINL